MFSRLVSRVGPSVIPPSSCWVTCDCQSSLSAHHDHDLHDCLSSHALESPVPLIVRWTVVGNPIIFVFIMLVERNQPLIPVVASAHWGLGFDNAPACHKQCSWSLGICLALWCVNFQSPPLEIHIVRDHSWSGEVQPCTPPEP